MFGSRNFTGITFLAKMANGMIEFSAGLVEEVIFNVTPAGPANALEKIPEHLNLDLMSKDRLIMTTAVAAGSNIVKTNVFHLIASATKLEALLLKKHQQSDKSLKKYHTSVSIFLTASSFAE